jgi:predicted CXXCH cytochrome family protein
LSWNHALAIVGVVAALILTPRQSAGQTNPIDGTKHDFSNTASYPWNVNGYKCEICHTPHGGTAVIGGLAWNHRLSSAAYSWNPTTTVGGTALPTNFTAWGGSSRFCLSCHDGTVAIGDLYVTNSVTGYGANCGLSECLSGTKKIGPDMSGNHPVAVPYPYGNATSTYNGITTGSAVDTSAGAFVAAPTVVRLYSETSGVVSVGGRAGTAGIECGSCHNAHYNTPYGKFLRDARATICSRCHSY